MTWHLLPDKEMESLRPILTSLFERCLPILAERKMLIIYMVRRYIII